uniref:Uncharacterized protein n=1 Tax=Caenorhabditis japonica TaxID=281687 RepID=A0A8R1I0M2_CAEJA
MSTESESVFYLLDKILTNSKASNAESMNSLLSVLLLFVVFAINFGQEVSFDEGGFEMSPEHRIFEFNQLHGYGEASRQLIAMQSINNREYEKDRERHRSSPKEWGLGEVLEKNAVFKGEISCHKMIGSDKINELNALGEYPEYEEFQIKNVQIIDEETGEHYPYIRDGDDFIAYNLQSENSHDRRYLTVLIKHKGCVSVNPGCIGVTKLITSYKNSPHHHMGFTRINLAVRYYEEECSLFRRVFNFWPFN